jgi:hypothetical protein
MRRPEPKQRSYRTRDDLGRDARCLSRAKNVGTRVRPSRVVLVTTTIGQSTSKSILPFFLASCPDQGIESPTLPIKPPRTANFGEIQDAANSGDRAPRILAVGHSCTRSSNPLLDCRLASGSPPRDADQDAASVLLEGDLPFETTNHGSNPSIMIRRDGFPQRGDDRVPTGRHFSAPLPNIRRDTKTVT